MEADLMRDGWMLSDKGLEYCKAICANKNPSKRDIITNALHTDIREIGKQSLPADINKQHSSEVRGPVVLQILKVKNVSAPNAKEDSSFAPRMLKLTMTDGVITCNGIELEAINSISLSTPPGSKVCLSGTLTVQHGFILLDSRNLKFLGGEVEHLRSKWEISKNVSKIQRKVLTAEGGPPMFIPFEDSDFAKRKPQGSSVTIKHVEANSKQKGKPPQKTEKQPKPFEEKKIWKSEPFNGKKGKNPAVVKGGSESKEKPENRQRAPKPEVIGKQSDQPDRLANKKNYNGREQYGGSHECKDLKDTASKVGKRDDERGKERNFGEEKRHPNDSYRESRNFKSDGSMHGRRDGNRSGRESYDSRGHRQQEDFSHERYEKSNKRRGRYETSYNPPKNALPPRLEKLRNNANEYGGPNFKEQKYSKDFSIKAEESQAGYTIDDDMKQVTDLINERMKFDDRNKEVKVVDRNKPTKDSTFKDRNYRRSDYNPDPNRGDSNPYRGDSNPSRGDSNPNRGDSKREGKIFNERKDRFGSEDQRSQHGRGHARSDRQGERERKYRSNGRGYDNRERGYDNRERGYDSHERDYDGRERSRSADQHQESGKSETRPRTGGQGFSNDSSKNLRSHGEVPSEFEFSKRNADGTVDVPVYDADVTNKKVAYSHENNYNNDMSIPAENDTHLTQDNEKSNKVKEFMNSVIHNNVMGGDLRLLRQHPSSDHSQAQSNIQPMMASHGQYLYYHPSFPVCNVNIQQGYQNIPTQEFQPAGFQPSIHPIHQPMGQYQQFAVSTTAQDYGFIQTVAPQNMNFQNQGMSPAGQQTRHRPRVRHDVYRPKRE